MNKQYRVTDPKGLPNDPEPLKKGDTFPGDPNNARVRAWLRFRQIEEVKGKAQDIPDGPNASAAARKLAEENGIDLATVTGSGEGGSITKPDVEAAIETTKKAAGNNGPPI